MFHPNGPTFLELARQALSSTRQGYDLLAPKFDLTPFRTPDFLLRPVAEFLQTLGPFGAGLDICCGTGAGLELLRPLCHARVVGLDFSKGMLAVCRQRLTTAEHPTPFHLVQADALAMPFADGFDLAVCFGAFGHILPRDEPRFVEEVARVLRPGGRFVFVTTCLPPVWSLRWWMARGFNAAMHVRNALFAPPFHMYYLTFLLPGATILLEGRGLRVEVRTLGYPKPWSDLRLVIATRP